MKTLYFAQCLHHEENGGKNSELFYLILRNRASQKVGQILKKFLSGGQNELSNNSLRD